jgi:Transglutaminase-like superfamily
MQTWSRPLASRFGALRRVRSLSDLRLFVRVFFFAVSVPLLMRLPLPKLRAVLTAFGRPSSRPMPAARVIESVDAVLRAGRPLIRPGCLTRGLTFYYFLRRAGLAVSLRFGVGHVGHDLAGHCWLVKDGEPYLEVSDPRLSFTETYSIP